jgi:hypothetical protein
MAGLSVRPLPRSSKWLVPCGLALYSTGDAFLIAVLLPWCVVFQARIYRLPDWGFGPGLDPISRADLAIAFRVPPQVNREAALRRVSLLRSAVAGCFIIGEGPANKCSSTLHSKPTIFRLSGLFSFLVVCIGIPFLCPALTCLVLDLFLQNGSIPSQASRPRCTGPQRVLAQGPSRSEAVNTEPSQGVRTRVTNGPSYLITYGRAGV